MFMRLVDIYWARFCLEARLSSLTRRGCQPSFASKRSLKRACIRGKSATGPNSLEPGAHQPQGKYALQIMDKRIEGRIVKDEMSLRILKRFRSEARRRLPVGGENEGKHQSKWCHSPMLPQRGEWSEEEREIASRSSLTHPRVGHTGIAGESRGGLALGQLSEKRSGIRIAH